MIGAKGTDPSAGSETVIVVGAGIVGVAAAIHLQRDGRRVVLVDERAPGEGTSFGHAGVLAGGSVVPVNAPGLLFKIPGMLADPLGPLSLSLAHLLRRLPWFVRYMLASRRSVVECTARGLAHLVFDTLEQHRALSAGTPAERWLKNGPYVHLYSDERGFRKDGYAWALRRAHGATWDEVSGEALRNLIPGLAPEGRFAVVLRDRHGFCADPGRYVKDLAAHFVGTGGTLVQAKVEGFLRRGGAVTGVATSAGAMPADRVVVAAGAWSGDLARSLGLHLPIESERGYHVMLKGARDGPAFPVLWTRGKCVLTPMTEGLRMAGQVEFAGLEAPPRPRRAEVLVEHARRLFPGIGEVQVESWMGHRPVLPDSLPAIGAPRHFPNVVFACGHHHVGFTAGPKTGRIVADMMAGHASNVDLSRYSPDRFS